MISVGNSSVIGANNTFSSLKSRFGLEIWDPTKVDVTQTIQFASVHETVFYSFYEFKALKDINRNCEVGEIISKSYFFPSEFEQKINSLKGLLLS